MASKFGECQLLSRTAQINFKYKWTIKRFSSLDSRVGKSYKSDVVQLEENGPQWFLKVYPGGEDEESEGCVSCFLNIMNITRDDVECKFHLSLLNTDDEILCDRNSYEWNVFDTEGWGWSETVELETLKRKLVNDTLVITLEATYCATSVTDRVSVNHETTLKMKVIDDLKNLWMSKKHSDLVISVGEKDIPVHSAVLCARSKVFSAMFEHKTAEKATRRIEVTDFNKDTMESFTEFMYSGSVTGMNFDLAMELLHASDKYDVGDLKSYCYNYLKPLLDDKNVCQVLLCADMFNSEKLRSHALEYFYENMSEMSFQNQRSIFESQPQLLCDIVEGMIKRQQFPKSVE